MALITGALQHRRCSSSVRYGPSMHKSLSGSFRGRCQVEPEGGLHRAFRPPTAYAAAYSTDMVSSAWYRKWFSEVFLSRLCGGSRDGAGGWPAPGPPAPNRLCGGLLNGHGVVRVVSEMVFRGFSQPPCGGSRDGAGGWPAPGPPVPAIPPRSWGTIHLQRMRLNVRTGEAAPQR